MTKKVGRAKPIPMKYVPARILILWKRGVINREHVWAAAQFCYLEEAQWLLHSVGTNFPKGYKVQTSVVRHEPNLDHTQVQPDARTMKILRLGVAGGASFKELALACGIVGERATLHRAGKRILRETLGKFAAHLSS